MDNIIREGEQFVENQEGNQGNTQGTVQNDYQDYRRAQEPQQDRQAQSGGMMKNSEQNAGDAYVNQGLSCFPSGQSQCNLTDCVLEVNGFLNKEGVPSAMDGAIDGAVDTEANKLEKDF